MLPSRNKYQKYTKKSQQFAHWWMVLDVWGDLRDRVLEARLAESISLEFDGCVGCFRATSLRCILWNILWNIYELYENIPEIDGRFWWAPEVASTCATESEAVNAALVEFMTIGYLGQDMAPSTSDMWISWIHMNSILIYVYKYIYIRI